MEMKNFKVANIVASTNKAIPAARMIAVACTDTCLPYVVQKINQGKVTMRNMLQAQPFEGSLSSTFFILVF